jgi:hypothetical protein
MGALSRGRKSIGLYHGQQTLRAEVSADEWLVVFADPASPVPFSHQTQSLRVLTPTIFWRRGQKRKGCGALDCVIIHAASQRMTGELARRWTRAPWDRTSDRREALHASSNGGEAWRIAVWTTRSFISTG